MPPTTWQAHKRRRSPRHVCIAHEEVDREESVPEGNPEAPPKQPVDPNQDILEALQNLIGIVQDRLPVGDHHVKNQNSGSHRSTDREWSRIPPPNPIESQAGHEPKSVHLPGPPLVAEPVYYERSRRDPGDLFREVMRL